ncbi:MAG: polysaccharide deacetylase family protein, partial [Asticcacaulis sp.]
YGSVQHPRLPLKPNEVVLTFDDGPRPDTTPEVLSALKAECVKATFFMTGDAVTQYPDLARLVVADGHTAGMHSYKHDNMNSLTPADQTADLKATDAALKAALGAGAAPFYRFPYLGQTEHLLTEARAQGITVFSIDAAANDWEAGETAVSVTNRLMNNLATSRGGIILLHDWQPVTAQAMPMILKALKDQGYSVVHVTWAR